MFGEIRSPSSLARLVEVFKGRRQPNSAKMYTQTPTKRKKNYYAYLQARPIAVRHKAKTMRARGTIMLVPLFYNTLPPHACKQKKKWKHRCAITLFPKGMDWCFKSVCFLFRSWDYICTFTSQNSHKTCGTISHNLNTTLALVPRKIFTHPPSTDSPVAHLAKTIVHIAQSQLGVSTEVTYKSRNKHL